MTLTNSTVSGNTALTNGGGIWAITASLLNCTIAENLALIGGGLFHGRAAPSASKHDRRPEPEPPRRLRCRRVRHLRRARATTSSATGGGTGFVNGVNGDIVGTFLNPIDPELGPLANNGGPTKTHALLAGSRAIDAGDNAGVPATDQRGLPRKKDGNFNGVAVVDIGAFER